MAKWTEFNFLHISDISRLYIKKYRRFAKDSRFFEICVTNFNYKYFVLQVQPTNHNDVQKYFAHTVMKNEETKKLADTGSPLTRNLSAARKQNISKTDFSGNFG